MCHYARHNHSSSPLKIDLDKCHILTPLNLSYSISSLLLQLRVRAICMTWATKQAFTQNNNKQKNKADYKMENMYVIDGRESYFKFDALALNIPSMDFDFGLELIQVFSLRSSFDCETLLPVSSHLSSTYFHMQYCVLCLVHIKEGHEVRILYKHVFRFKAICHESSWLANQKSATTYNSRACTAVCFWSHSD